MFPVSNRKMNKYKFTIYKEVSINLIYYEIKELFLKMKQHVETLN